MKIHYDNIWAAQILISGEQGCITEQKQQPRRQRSHVQPPSLKTQSHAIMLLFVQYDIHLFLASVTLNASGIKYGTTAPCAILDKHRVKAKALSQTARLGRGVLH